MKFLYQFNKIGKLEKIHLSVKDVTIMLNVNFNIIYSAINHGRIVNDAFYFSYDKNFIIPERFRNDFAPIYDAWRIFGEKRKQTDYFWQPWKSIV